MPIDTLMALAVGGLFVMCMATLFAAAARAMASSLPRVPMAMATANAATLLRHRLAMASCIQTPKAGQQGETLIGYVGRFGPDCADKAPDADAPSPTYFVFCRGATAQGDKLLMRTGAAADGPIAEPECGEAGGDPWYALTPLDVRISSCYFGRFNGNQVNAGLKFHAETSLPADYPMEREVIWTSTFTTLEPMDAPG